MRVSGKLSPHGADSSARQKTLARRRSEENTLTKGSASTGPVSPTRASSGNGLLAYGLATGPGGGHGLLHPPGEAAAALEGEQDVAHLELVPGGQGRPLGGEELAA